MNNQNSCKTPILSKYHGFSKGEIKQIKKAGGVDKWKIQKEEIKKKREAEVERQRFIKEKGILSELSNIAKVDQNDIVKKNKKLQKMKHKEEVEIDVSEYEAIKGNNFLNILFFVIKNLQKFNLADSKTMKKYERQY